MKLPFSKAASADDAFLFADIFRKFYYGSLVAILFGCIGQIVGNMVAGNTLGEDGLAVMSLGLPVYYVFATVGNVTGIGGSALCARLAGRMDRRNALKSVTVTYLLTAVLCVLFSVLVWLFLPTMLDLLGVSETLREGVRTYGGIMAIGGIFTAGVYLSFNFLRLDGRPVATTLTFAIMAVVNVTLDILLAPWGVAGIAWATVAGNAAATLFGLALILLRGRSLGFGRITLREFFSFSVRIFRIGSPGAVENASILLRSYCLNRFIAAWLGATALSSFSVVHSVDSFSLAITVGSAGALVPIIGVLSTERDSVSIRRTVRFAVRLGGTLLVPFIAATVAFAPTIARLFGVTDALDATATAIRLFALSLPFTLFSNVLIYVHLANGHTGISNVLTVLKYLVFAVGFALVLIRWKSEIGLWLSFAVSEVAVLLAAAGIHLVVWRKNRVLSPVLLLDTRFERKETSIVLTTGDDDGSIADTVGRLRQFCEQNRLTRKRSLIVTLATEEMLHMAAEHSTRMSRRHRISVRVILRDDILILRLRYVGTLFNPIEYYEQKKTDTNDLNAMLELRDCLGIKMVIDTCDVVDYQTTFGINNLTIVT